MYATLQAQNLLDPQIIHFHKTIGTHRGRLKVWILLDFG